MTIEECVSQPPSHIEVADAQQDAIAQLSVRALQGLPLDDILQLAVDQAGVALGAVGCSLYLLEDGLLRRKASSTSLPERDEGAAQPLETASQPYGWIQLDLPELLHGSENRPGWPPLLAAAGLPWVLVGRLGTAEQPMGLLLVGYAEEPDADTADAEFLAEFCELLTAALRNAHITHALRLSEERMELARAAARIGIFDWDIDSGRIYWDAMTREIWGVPPDLAVTYEDFEAGLHPDDRERTQRVVDGVLGGGQDGMLRIEYRVINKADGRERWVEARARTHYDSEGWATRMVGTIRDITQRKRNQLSLRQAVSKLERADRRKDEFLAVLGHELRNPLAALSASLEILNENLRDPAELMDIMTGSVASMSRLLDELLDITRISRNRIVLKRRSVRLAELVPLAAEAARNRCEEAPPPLHIDVDQSLCVYADPERLKQMLSNLLVNASQAQDGDGEVRVLASASDGMIRIRVEDDGVGLAPAELERVFEAFYQVPVPARMNVGLGIGLTIVKTLAALHGGSISAHSDGPGKGACFELLLPAALEEAEPAEELISEKATIPSGLELVVVEDNDHVAGTMSTLLEGAGCVVRLARSGEEGVRLGEALPADAMLIDLGLPDISGYEVARRLRAGGCESLLIAVSGYGHEAARNEAQASGFDFHLAKPARKQELARILSRLRPEEAN